MRDLRYAVRVLLNSPGFTLIAVLSLALGLGANAAIFNLLDQILLRPLPVKDAARFVLLEAPGANRGMFEGDNSDRLMSQPFYTDVRDRNPVFESVIARYPTRVNIAGNEQSESVGAEVVSGNFFEALGIAPAQGRLIAPADDVQKGGHPVAVLSYGYWQRRFGGDAKAVGSPLRVNSTLMTVIGVTPAGFFGVHVGRSPEIYVPIAMKAQITPTWDGLGDRKAHWLHVMAKLKPGLSREQAQAGMQVLFKPILEADLAAMSGNISQKFRDRYLAKQLLLRPAQTGVPTFREGSESALEIVMAMVGLVLLIACANVANLLIARALGRQKEIAVRLSLGASRWNLMRQLITESLLLSLGGAVVGLICASWTSDLLLKLIPADETPALTAALDTRAIVFCFGLSILTGIIFGLIPALQATRPNVNSVLKDQSGSVVGGFGQIRSRQALVVAQVALSLLLLIGAGLFTRSLGNLFTVDPGFRVSNLVLLTVDAARNGYDQPRVHQVYDQIEQRLAALPGVVAAAASDIILLSGDNTIHGTSIEGYQFKPEERSSMNYNSVSAGYFSTLGIQVLAGREFTGRDLLGAPKVAIVNETFASKYFGNGSPLGRHIGNFDQKPDIEIVGMVKDGKYDSLRNEKLPVVYVPYQQQKNLSGIHFHVRTGGDPAGFMQAIRIEVAKVDPLLPVSNMHTMELQIQQSLFGERLLAGLCACFGALATILAAIGLYGVTAYSVTRRTREIGIRIALGAARQSVVRMVLREVLILSTAGILVGLPLSMLLSRFVGALLYGVKPNDPATMAVAACALMVVSIVAGAIPAGRASSVDPIVALRYE